MSSGAAKGKVSLYLLSGLATAPLFMESFRTALHDVLEREEVGYKVASSELLFPYGDWFRGVVPQLWEIGRDLRLSPRKSMRSIGGRRAVAAIRESRVRHGLQENGEERIVLIGHSGGGVAAVHAAMQLLEQDGGGGGSSPQPLVIMIGSPRCRIPEQLRQSVLFVYAAAEAPTGERNADVISKLGTFGGWGRGSAVNAAGSSIGAGRRMLPGWQHDKHGPAGACGVPIIGRHPDYFREQAPFINELGLSNQWLTLQAVWNWLRDKI